MSAFYNENDRFACDWLSNLMDAGLITPGKIDDRSIVDVRPDDLAGYERVHFFAGIGGWDHALTLAGWRGPVWTGSCPCQPFSLAGKQKGFADDRHLWPVWRDLIAERRPAKVFGEQVASATEWLRIVRSDLEALGYAVGAIPFQAASAGADHLRDRYGLVADGERGAGDRRTKEPQRQTQERVAADGLGTIELAHADDMGSQGRVVLPERAGQRAARPNGLEHAACERWSEGRPEPSIRRGRDAVASASILVNAQGEPEREPNNEGNALTDGGQARPISGGAGDYEWVIGADGKARRVKSGICLLVDAFPNRVGLLRGFGNAIDPEAFAQFIAAAGEAMRGE